MVAVAIPEHLSADVQACQTGIARMAKGDAAPAERVDTFVAYMRLVYSLVETGVFVEEVVDITKLPELSRRYDRDYRAATDLCIERQIPIETF